MTTSQAAALYEWKHKQQMSGRKWAVFNPHNKPVEELPIIYGFNNGGAPGFLSACLMAENGANLGGHLCSSEGYMEHDLGILEGTRPDRHKVFQEHYPNGYKMEFVKRDEVLSHNGLVAAYKKQCKQAKGE